MGNTLWIESRGRPRAETQRDLSILGKLDRELDKLAMRLGVTTLSSFYDDSVLIESYAELAEEAAVKAESPVPKWFDSIKGLETIKALRDRLQNDFGEVNWRPEKSKQHWPQHLLDEMKFCQAVLEDAVAQEQQFRLLIVP